MYFTVNALAKVFDEVTILSVEPLDWRIYEEITEEKKPSNVKNVSIFKRRIGYFGIYQRILPSFYLGRIDHDIVINTHGDSLALFNIRKPYIVYLHFPSLALLTYNPTLKYRIKNPKEVGLLRFLVSLGWRAYFEPYRVINKILFPRNIEKAVKIIVNSRFTKEVTAKVCAQLGIGVANKIEIVNPPVPHFDTYAKLRARKTTDKPRVITIGRFTPDKNYELVVEVAKKLRDVEFVIIGSVGKSKIYRQYYEKIKSIAPPNLKLVADASEKEKLELLSSGRVYLHTMLGEHFGIAPAEAAVAGLTLVVHKESGTWTDICYEGRYCYGFARADANEVADLVAKALREPNPVPLSAIEKLHPSHFSEAMIRIVMSALGRS